MNWIIIIKSLGHHDMRKRILAVLGILLIFRILAHIPVPLGDPQTLHQVLSNLFNSSNTPQLLSFINVLSGGALANFSIMIAGLGPFINASIIMQLLTKAIPQLEALHKEGEFGQKKINQYTRLLTFPLAIIQSIGSIYLIRQAAQSIGGIGDITANASFMQWALMVAGLQPSSVRETFIFWPPSAEEVLSALQPARSAPPRAKTMSAAEARREGGRTFKREAPSC